MSLAANSPLIPHSHVEQLREARAIIRHEAEVLERLSTRLDTSFCAAVAHVQQCRGRIIVTGIGKAGLIGQKICATLSSTGTPAHFLHPVEAVHGDLGCLQNGDVVIALSNSGETEELCRILPIVRDLGAAIIAITSHDENTLARNSDVTLVLGKIAEAGAHGLAPSSSTTAMLAMGDALALTVCSQRGFTRRDFAVFHPGGNLGLQLRRVREVMRPRTEIRVANQAANVREVFGNQQDAGAVRRTGAVILVDDGNRLKGLFTDSDLARLLGNHREDQLDRPICEVMTCEPLTVLEDALLQEAVELLSSNKISELPVINDEQQPVGLIDITDVLALVPKEVSDGC